tara:strand:- start:196 stop:525 length:330 start_codon:yes stop_codon:yes gene_type:complete
MYLPAKHRGGDRRKQGARKRSNKGKYAREVASGTDRNIFKGMADLRGLAAGISEGIEGDYEELLEEQETIYEENMNYELEEKLLLEVNQDVRNLIAGLEEHNGFETSET